MKIKGYCIGLLGLLLVACQREEVVSPWETGGSDGDLQLQLSTKGLMNRYVVTTKGTDVKTSEEQEIKTLHVFLFDEDGNYLKAKDANRYQNYIAGGRTVINIDRQGWEDEGKASNATVVVVANVEDGTFQYASTSQPPTNIPDRDSLLRFVYRPLEKRVVKNLPESGMPMFAYVKGVDLTDSNPAQSIDIPLQAMMARVDVSLQLNSNASDASGLLPSLTLTKCEVLNAPAGVQLDTTGMDETDLDKVGKVNYSWQPAVQTLYNRDGAAEVSFYVFENRQLPAYEGYPNEYPYPDSVSIDQRQKYKPLLADTEKALAFRFTGNYVTYNGGVYEATYTLYLGANHTDDFNVRRNKQYKNNITIKGLVNNQRGDDGKVTFDARVNVTETNPYFISMLKDRTMDSHFNVVPVDVYFFNNTPTGMKRPNQTIDVSVDVDWIRFEKVDSAMMADGKAPNGDCIATGTAWQAGNGKRKYFTTDLVTNTLFGNSSVTGLRNRDRVYLYVDENLEVWRLDEQGERTRMATMTITYKEDGKVVSSRELVLEQAKLLEVTFHGPNNGGGNDETNDWADRKIYIEAYEEYLDYADPLDKYASDQVFKGLPWEDYEGSGTLIGRTWCENGGGIWGNYFDWDVDCSNNLYWGHDFTEIIAQKVEARQETSGGWFPTTTYYYDHLNLNTKPKTAAGYCFIKNKRHADGSVPNPKWYLPGIRELERILEDYYIDYPEFREHFYWSSAAGEGNEGDNENRNYVRATKAFIKEDGTSFDYWESGTGNRYEDGNGGFAPRKTILRIRAARIDAEPQ